MKTPLRWLLPLGAFALVPAAIVAQQASPIGGNFDQEYENGKTAFRSRQLQRGRETVQERPGFLPSVRLQRPARAEHPAGPCAGLPGGKQVCGSGAADGARTDVARTVGRQVPSRPGRRHRRARPHLFRADEIRLFGGLLQARTGPAREEVRTRVPRPGAGADQRGAGRRGIEQECGCGGDAEAGAQHSRKEPGSRARRPGRRLDEPGTTLPDGGEVRRGGASVSARHYHPGNTVRPEQR